MKKDSFVRGALILSLGMLVAKVLGATYRIGLPRLLGDEGVGLFNYAYPVYVVALVLSTAGIPIAISKLVAEKAARGDGRGALRVFRLSLLVLTVLGLVLSLAMFWTAGFVARFVVRDPRAYYPIVAVAPAIFFVSVMSAYRGFFQGLQYMTPTAVSQIVEQLVRVGTIFLLGFLLLPQGIEFAAAGGTFGAVTGGVVGLVYLVVVYLRGRDRLLGGLRMDETRGSENAYQVLARIIYLSVPISLAALVFPVIQNIDLFVVPGRLQSMGLSATEAAALYGELSGMAMPLVYMPTVFTTALAFSLVPAISEAMVLRREAVARSRAQTALRLTLFLSLPATVGLYLLSTEITTTLYANPHAGSSLAVVSPGLLFLAVQQTTSGILQGMGRVDIPFRNLVYGAVAKLVLTWVLVPVPGLGINGAALGTVAGFLIAAGLNITAVYGLLALPLELSGLVWKPAIAVLIMAVSVRGTYELTLAFTGSNTLSTLGAIGAGVVVYGLVLLLVGSLRTRDVEMFPRFGPRLARFLKAAGMLRE